MNISTLEELESIPPKDVHAFLLRNDGFAPCSACGGDDWEINTESKTGRIVYVYQDIVTLPNRSLVFLPVTCRNCLNTRFFNALPMAYRIVHGGSNDD